MHYLAAIRALEADGHISVDQSGANPDPLIPAGDVETADQVHGAAGVAEVGTTMIEGASGTNSLSLHHQ